MTLRQLVNVAYQALCERIGKDDADEVLDRVVAEAEAAGQPYVSASEKQARHELLRMFGAGGVTSSPV